jgi:hypothetical protein
MRSPFLFLTLRTILLFMLWILNNPFSWAQKEALNFSKKDTLKEPVYHGYNILLPKKFTVEQLIETINKGLNIDIKINDHVKSCPCDTLINIDYPGLEFNGQDNMQVKVRHGQGLDLDIPGLMANKNYEFSLGPELGIESVKKSIIVDKMLDLDSRYRVSAKKQIVTLAILDSGIDSNLQKLSYVGVKNPVGSCLFTKVYGGKPNPLHYNGLVPGLNFAPVDRSGTPYNMFDVNDDENGHGTRVAYLAAEQFKLNKVKRVRLLIMKVLNRQNKGDAFGVMCAMYHAKQMGAQIMNMSLGYYGPEDLIFKRYINEMKPLNSIKTKQNFIWIVSAAGNSMEGFDSHGDRPSNAPEDRDLGRRSLKFYPAYFSKELDHVISVNTADDDLKRTCDYQNYDKESVDISVKGENCLFSVNRPMIDNQLQKPLHGTSYASPVVAGWIGTRVNLNGTKSDILNRAIVSRELENFTLRGLYIIPQAIHGGQ